jgi:hypothetical protein
MVRYAEGDQLRFYKAVAAVQTGYKGRIGLRAHDCRRCAKKLIQERARVAELFASAVNSGMRIKMDGMESVDGLDRPEAGSFGVHQVTPSATFIEWQATYLLLERRF